MNHPPTDIVLRAHLALKTGLGLSRLGLLHNQGIRLTLGPKSPKPQTAKPQKPQTLHTETLKTRRFLRLGAVQRQGCGFELGAVTVGMHERLSFKVRRAF